MLELTQEQTKYTIDVLTREYTRLYSETNRIITMFRNGDCIEQTGIDATRHNLREMKGLADILAVTEAHHIKQRYGCITPSKQKRIDKQCRRDKKYVEDKKVELEGIIAKQQILPF